MTSEDGKVGERRRHNAARTRFDDDVGSRGSRVVRERTRTSARCRSRRSRRSRPEWGRWYGGRGADQWWEKNLTALERLDNLTVMNLPLDGSRVLVTLAQPSMQLQCTVQEGQIWMADGENTAHIELTILKDASTPFRQ